MMKLTITAIFALLTATPAIAVPLWNNIEIGMSGDQVNALYPEKVPDLKKPGKLMRVGNYIRGMKTEIWSQETGNCHSFVIIEFPHNVVSKITISPNDGCDLRPSLLTKYGPPATSVSDFHTENGVVLFGRRITEDSVQTTAILTWIVGQVTITYNGHNVVYESAPTSTGL